MVYNHKPFNIINEKHNDNPFNVVECDIQDNVVIDPLTRKSLHSSNDLELNTKKEKSIIRLNNDKEYHANEDMSSPVISKDKSSLSCDSPLFSDCSISDASIASDIADSFITPIKCPNITPKTACNKNNELSSVNRTWQYRSSVNISSKKEDNIRTDRRYSEDYSDNDSHDRNIPLNKCINEDEQTVPRSTSKGINENVSKINNQKNKDYPQTINVANDLIFSDDSFTSDNDDDIVITSEPLVNRLNNDFDTRKESSECIYPQVWKGHENNINFNNLTPLYKPIKKIPQTASVSTFKMFKKALLEKNKENKVEKIHNHERSPLSSNVENDIIFSESDEDTKSYKTKAQKVLSKLRKSTKDHTKLDFISSLMNDVDDDLRHSDALRYRSNFLLLKEELGVKIYHIFNEHVFLDRLPFDIVIEWREGMVSTAGFCCYSRHNKEHNIKIKLSTRILDNTEKLLWTLIHEMCHGGVWMIFKRNGGHGPLWKLWTNEAHRTFPNVPLSTRCHRYETYNKYEYWCVSCRVTMRVRGTGTLISTLKWSAENVVAVLFFERLPNGQRKIYETYQILTEIHEFIKRNYEKYISTGMTHEEVKMMFHTKYKLPTVK